MSSQTLIRCGTFVNGGRYLVNDKLGHGAFCSVYSATDESQKAVAIKFYEHDEQNHALYTKELRALRTLNSDSHQYVMRLLDYFSYMTVVDNRVHVYLCAVVHKYTKTLSDILDAAQDGLELSIARPLFRQILHGVEHIHKHGIVHADLKPDNIMLAMEDNDLANATVGITDFNHAVFVADGKFPTSGTQEYCSIEQILGLPYSYPADIWALGCIFYQMVTSRQLFALDDIESSETTETESEPPLITASSDSAESDSDSEEEVIDEFKSSYDHCVCIYQLLGTPPKSIIDAGKKYFSRRGKPVFNPETETLDLAKIMHTKFHYPKLHARQITRFVLTMVKYLPLQRLSPASLLAQSAMLT